MRGLLLVALAIAGSESLCLPSYADAERQDRGSRLSILPLTLPPEAASAGPAPTQAPVIERPVSAGARPPREPVADPRGLGGLAVRGLLAALFTGGSFQGLRPIDVLLVLLPIGLGIGALLVRRRGARGGVTPARGRAASVRSRRAGQAERRRPAVLPCGMGEWVSRAAGRDEAPAWLDGPGFLEEAKLIFVQFQSAWDHADYDDLSEHATPQLFAELLRKRRALEEARLAEVLQLHAELAGIIREEGLALASVRFTGLAREEEQGLTERFDQVWHLQHAWSGREGNWLIRGIRGFGGQADARLGCAAPRPTESRA